MSDYGRTRRACYAVNVSMAVVSALSPLLFSAFSEQYGVSYSQLGFLVLVNFCTQLLVDLMFSFWSHRFPIARTVRLMPLLTVAGLLIYALVPLLAPSAAYPGLLIGTVVFSASAGLAEVLISPLIAAIPSDNPERAMSKLHSVYAWGVVGVVAVSTAYLFLAGKERWHWLALIWIAVPMIAAVLFACAPIPPMEVQKKSASARFSSSGRICALCVCCIFFGGASECTMSQWSSGYLEQALQIPKIWGDLLGVALFALMLGLGRSLYASFGKRIYRALIAGSCGAVICYLAAALTTVPAIGLASCALTGLCTAMLWPGSLIVLSDRIKNPPVALFALMAAGGDLGGSVGPQLVGVVTDLCIASPLCAGAAERIGLSPEQFGMKAGMLIAVLFPLLAAVCFICAMRTRRNRPRQIHTEGSPAA